MFDCDACRVTPAPLPDFPPNDEDWQLKYIKACCIVLEAETYLHANGSRPSGPISVQ